MPRKHLPDQRQAEEQTSAAARMRRTRARRKAGDRWIPGFDVRGEVLERLVDEGWTTEAEASNPQRLSDAVADLLDCWARGTLPDCVTPQRERA